MNDMPMFYQKNGWAVVKLARDLINMEVGDRIASVSQYAEAFGAGRGTIQYALKFLLDHGCMTLFKHGPKGTFVASLNQQKLWEYSDWGTLLCASPGVVDASIAALLTGLYANLTEQQVPFNLVNMTNSGSRLRELANGRYHFVITTRLAMQAAGQEYPGLVVVEDLAGCQYLQPYELFHHQPHFAGVQNGMRLAVNSLSLEQNYIADALCAGKDVQRLYMSHQQANQAFEAGEADLLIARPVMAKMEVGGDVYRESLFQLGLDEASTVPVIVANNENYGMVNFLQKRLRPGQIRELQAEVLAGLRKPAYY